MAVADIHVTSSSEGSWTPVSAFEISTETADAISDRDPKIRRIKTPKQTIARLARENEILIQMADFLTQELIGPKSEPIDDVPGKKPSFLRRRRTGGRPRPRH